MLFPKAASLRVRKSTKQQQQQHSPWVTGCLTGAASVGSRSPSFPSASNHDRSHAGKREDGLAKRTSLESGSSEAAVALTLTTSGPWLKSWQTSGVVYQWQVTRVTMT